MRREKNLEEAKKVVIKNDPSLPEPKCVSRVQCLISSVLSAQRLCLCVVVMTAVEGHCPVAVTKCTFVFLVICIPEKDQSLYINAFGGYLNLLRSCIRLFSVSVCWQIPYGNHLEMFVSFTLVGYCHGGG